MSDAFEEGWEEIAKASPCPLCNAAGGQPCRGKGMPDHPANRCKLRRRAMEAGYSGLPGNARYL